MKEIMAMETSLIQTEDGHTRLEIYRECELDAKYRNPKTKLNERLKRDLRRNCDCTSGRLKSFFLSTFPIFSWLPNYNMKNNLLGDVAAGLTVGIVHIPQGLAYASLATLPPKVGLYVSLFPVLLYPFFGTSRHVSMGTFAIISILISGILGQYVPYNCNEVNSVPTDSVATPMSSINHTISNSEVTGSSESCESLYDQRKIEVAIAVSICVGLLQILMSVFRLGTITVFLSDSLLSGFLCGASFLVITSQVPKLFGIEVQRYTPPFALIYTYIELFREMGSINWATFIISTICTIFLFAGKEVNQRYKKKLPVPIPWELFIVIATTILSYFLHMETKYEIEIVGNITKGIKTSVPRGSDVADVFFASVPLAIIAFTVEISLCQIFATKHSYQVDSNQELLALGVCNIFGAFFSCYPSAASLSRSVIYEEVGAKTQLGAYFSCAVVLTVLLWIGPLFQPLPQAALAVIIIVNIKNVVLLWRNVKPLWRISRLDAVTWVVAWLSVIVLGVSMGLMTGVLFSILTVLVRTRNVTGLSLRKVSHRGVYRDSRKYSTIPTHDDIFIYQFTGPLFFANKDRFSEQLNVHLGFDTIKESKITSKKRDIEQKDTDKPACNGNDRLSAKLDGGEDTIVQAEELHSRKENESSSRSSSFSISHYTHVIFDMNRCSFVDSDGAKLIRELYDAFTILEISLMLSSCSDDVKRALAGSWKDREPAIYVSLDGAIQFAKNQLIASSIKEQDEAEVESNQDSLP